MYLNNVAAAAGINTANVWMPMKKRKMIEKIAWLVHQPYYFSVDIRTKSNDEIFFVKPRTNRTSSGGKKSSIANMHHPKNQSEGNIQNNLVGSVTLVQ